MGGEHSKGKKSSKENRKQQKQMSQFVGLPNDESDKGSYNPRPAWSSDGLYPSSDQNCAGGVSRNKVQENMRCPNFLSSDDSTISNSNERKTRIRSKGSRSVPNVASGPSNIEDRKKSIRNDKYAPSAPVLDCYNESDNRSEQPMCGNLPVHYEKSRENFPTTLGEKVCGCGPGRSENHKFKDGGKPRSNENAERLGRKSKSSNAEGCEEEPPKYEDAIMQPAINSKIEVPVLQNNKPKGKYQPLNANIVSKKTKRPAEEAPPGVQNSITRVEELNDRIRKQFGSVGGPIEFLSNVDMSDKPFPVRNKLFIRNLPPNTTRNDLEALMSRYGEITVDFIDNETRVCCLRVKQQAEAAQRNLDGSLFRGRTLRVHFGNRDVRFKALNLDEWVTNELLKKAFSIFGEVERAEVILDGEGFCTGEGYLEFAHRTGGQRAYEACKEGCFLLTASLRPVILSKLNPDIGCRGNYETYQLRKNPQYLKGRQVGPRFVAEGSSEYTFAIFWKELIENRRAQQEELQKKFLEEEERICTQIEVLKKSEETRLKTKRSYPSCR